MTTTHTITVLGGTGHTGRRVVRRLRHRGIPVRVGSRAGVPEFRWERPETWAPLLDGAAAAFVAYTPDIAFPGADGQTLTGVVSSAFVLGSEPTLRVGDTDVALSSVTEIRQGA